MSDRNTLKGNILRNMILLIVVIFLMVMAGFYLAVRIFAVDQLKSQLKRTEEIVSTNSDTAQGFNRNERRSMMESMIRDGVGNQDTGVLFLYKDKTVSLNNMRTPQGMRNMMGQNMGMRQRNQDYSNDVLSYIQGSDTELKDYDYKRIDTDRNSYYIKSIPFGDEFIVAYIPVRIFDGFISNTMKLLVLILILALAAAYFFARFLSQRITEPIRSLEDFALKIGSGDFHEQDLGLKEKELVQFNSSLNTAASQLNRYRENQKIFFQNVSHELRTPLTSIEGYAEGIKYGVFAPEEAGNVIISESRKLEDLIEDILYLSKLESGETDDSKKSGIRISDLILGVKDELSAMEKLSSKTVRCEIPDDKDVLINVEETENALKNLLKNALRYGDKEAVMRGEVRNDHLILTVSDDGPGVEEEMKDKIFDRFVKGKEGMHGIGLSIAKTAAEKQGGTLLLSDSEKGASFVMTIPLGQSSQKQSE